MSPISPSPVVLVTGGAVRLGSVAAEVFASRGWDVVIHHRGPAERADAVIAAVRALGRSCWALEADLEDPGAAAALVPAAAELGGRLDGVVNNASIFEAGRLSETDDALLDRHLRVNLRAPLILIREFARVAGDRGLVVNLLDSRIESLDWTHFCYTLSKQSLAAATRMAALEFAPRIRVNGIAPGPVLPPVDKDREYLERRVAETPLARSGGAQDVADALGWLIDSDYVTGQVLYVDGGQHLDPYKRGAGNR